MIRKPQKQTTPPLKKNKKTKNKNKTTKQHNNNNNNNNENPPQKQKQTNKQKHRKEQNKMKKQKKNPATTTKSIAWNVEATQATNYAGQRQNNCNGSYCFKAQYDQMLCSPVFCMQQGSHQIV